jgi:hypothetical protein
VIRNIDFLKGGQLEDSANLFGLGWCRDYVDDFYAERQQEAALDALSNYKLNPQPVLYDAAGVAPKTIQAVDNPASD